MPNALSGKALTVLGAVEADTMGVTLPHEHLLIDFAVMYRSQRQRQGPLDEQTARRPVDPTLRDTHRRGIRTQSVTASS